LRGISELQKQIELLQEQKLKLEAFITEQKDRLVDQQNDINKKKLEIQNYREDIHNLEEHHKEVLMKERENVHSWTMKYETEQLRSANLADKIINLESKIVLEIEEKENYKIKVYELET
jgi:chromosome segregation ATPase